MGAAWTNILGLTEHFLGHESGGIRSTIGRVVIRHLDYTRSKRRHRFESAASIPHSNFGKADLGLTYWAHQLWLNGLTHEGVNHRQYTFPRVSDAVLCTPSLHQAMNCTQSGHYPPVPFAMGALVLFSHPVAIVE